MTNARRTNAFQKTLLAILLALPALCFSRIIGGPDDPIIPDSLLNKPLGHAVCLIKTDTNCVSQEITLSAFNYYIFTGILEPILAPWSTGVTAHKIIVSPPGTWSWNTAGIGCDHFENTITFDDTFFSGSIDIQGPTNACSFNNFQLTVDTAGYNAFSAFEWSPPYNILTPYPVSSAGTYALTLSDAFGCTFTDQFVVPTLPPASE